MNIKEKMSNEWTKENTIEPIKVTVNSAENLEQDDKEELTAWLDENYGKIQKLVEAVDDEIDLKMTISIKYIQNKTLWMTDNTLINYCYERGELPDEKMIYKATVIAKFLKSLEQFLEPEDLNKITDFLSKPVTEPES